MGKQLFGFGVGAVVLYSLFSGGGDRGEAKAVQHEIERWGLKQNQVSIIKDCRASLSRHNKVFKEGLSHRASCACMAQKIGRSVEPAHYQYASNVFDIIVEVSTNKNAPRDLFKLIKEDQTLDGLSSKQRFKLYSTASNALGFCGKGENVIESPELRKIYLKAKTKKQLQWQNK